MNYNLAAIVFWCGAALVLFTYAIYPLLIWSLSRTFGVQRKPSGASSEIAPTVSLLIAAHNEEQCIEARIRNALASDYPRDKLEIVIASDGSDDRTNDIVREFASDGVKLLDYPDRRGKATVLNDSVDQVSGDIVVFSDANTHYENDAIRRLVGWFAEPQIGAVCGKLVLTDAASGRNADGIYWRYESFLKQCEGTLGGLLGANGAIYALRRKLFCPVPAHTIIDDFVIPLLAKLQHGFRIVFEPTAVAHEETAANLRGEFRRRVRIGTGDYQSLMLLWPLLHPRHGWTSFTFFCHKLLRWASPFLLVAVFAANLFLLSHPLYQVFFLAQLAFYAAAIVGFRLSGNHAIVKLLRATSLFCSVNAALLVGFWRWLVTTPTGTWQRTGRDAKDTEVAPIL
jgi:cellulose synthase/poly-beta-1,6-N-acetylglucosamine synthase-like glycosyltransferase